MKTIVKKLVRDEKGQAMVLVLILLIVGGLIVAPLLAYMGTGLIAGGVYEKRTAELYAADAGVEDAIWKIQHNEGNLPCSPGHSWPYNITDVNGKKVEYTITYVDALTYRVVSTATGDGSGTKIDAYITAVVKSSGILDHVITSRCGYNLQGGQSQVNPPEGEEHGPEGNYAGAWPTVEMLSDLYWENVKDYPYTYDNLDVKDYATGIGPLSRNGTLDIKNTGDKGLTVILNGTVYITGDTSIGTTNVGKDFILDLNGQTIFVESASGAAPEDDPCSPGNDYALIIGGGCTLVGSGCIIAVGNIEFKPNLDCSKDDYILVLSVSGKTYMQPNGDFWGTLAGNAEVYIQNGEATWTDYSAVEGGLNFPSLSGVQQVSCSIASWEVTRLPLE